MVRKLWAWEWARISALAWTPVMERDQLLQRRHVVRHPHNGEWSSGPLARFASSPPHAHHNERERRPEEERHDLALRSGCNNRTINDWLTLHCHTLFAVLLRLQCRRAASGLVGRSCYALLRAGAVGFLLSSLVHAWITECTAISSAAWHAHEIKTPDEPPTREMRNAI